MSIKHKITQISVDNEAQIVSITWGDNVKSEFNTGGLRRVCPCVFCRGGHEFMGKKMDAQELLRQQKTTRKVTSLKPVGNYALQFTWSDGHNTGLYQIEALRELWDDYVELLTPRDL
jgi:DUF971 family protein